MRIAEKLTTIAENQQKVFAAGKAEGKAEAEAHNAAILTDCNAVLPDKGVEPADTLEQVPQRIGEIQSYADGYDIGVEDGKQAEYDRSWDAYQENGNRYEYQYAFYSDWWTDNVYNPKYPINATGGNGINSMFMNNNSITDTKVPIVVGTANSKRTATQAFNNCKKLKIIRLVDFTNASAAVNTFYRCDDLEEIRFVGSISISISFADSSKLSAESVQNITDHLADLTGKEAQTLTFNWVVYDILTEEQQATITAKNWTLVRA